MSPLQGLIVPLATGLWLIDTAIDYANKSLDFAQHKFLTDDRNDSVVNLHLSLCLVLPMDQLRKT